MRNARSDHAHRRHDVAPSRARSRAADAPCRDRTIELRDVGTARLERDAARDGAAEHVRVGSRTEGRTRSDLRRLRSAFGLDRTRDERRHRGLRRGRVLSQDRHGRIERRAPRRRESRRSHRRRWPQSRERCSKHDRRLRRRDVRTALRPRARRVRARRRSGDDRGAPSSYANASARDPVAAATSSIRRPAT